MYSADHPDGSDWQSVDPPFPPVDLAPFRDRFVRLHAGAVADEQGRALVILGESGYGKSTLCFRLTADHGYSLLTDEDAFVHRRSRLIEPFPVGYAPWKTHVDVPAIQPTIADSAATIERILVLRPPGRAAEKPSKIGSKECLWALLEGQRPSGTPHPEVIATLTALARSVPAAEMSGGRYRNLINAAADVADFGEVSAV
jgi:hypothetical protein